MEVCVEVIGLAGGGAGPSRSSNRTSPIPASFVCYALIQKKSVRGGDKWDHFQTIDLDAIEEDQPCDFDGGVDDHNLDGGVEFRVGHHFCCREAMQMGSKNYNICRAAKYRVIESDSFKYCYCRCK
ncbi:hypothetical protein PIB30_082148 [Stylosanthes scabra]|uniref:Uncharacterized protein n=1 Tax=Stylosanthes scabra TaxID=79078 RepID=A0ABU6SS74_9FABA|nr:hypothetical protein [Stylosanthes scabra]